MATSAWALDSLETGCVGRVGEQYRRFGVVQPVGDPLIAIEDRHREQNRAELPGTEEESGGLRGRRQDQGDTVTLFDAESAEQVGRLVR